MRKKENITDILRTMRDVMLSKKHVLNVEELESYTGISKSYIYKLTSRRQIPFYKNGNGKVISFKRSEIDKWLLSQQMATL